jgi:hypothetical protein
VVGEGHGSARSQRGARLCELACSSLKQVLGCGEGDATICGFIVADCLERA